MRPGLRAFTRSSACSRSFPRRSRLLPRLPAAAVHVASGVRSSTTRSAFGNCSGEPLMPALGSYCSDKEGVQTARHVPRFSTTRGADGTRGTPSDPTFERVRQARLDLHSDWRVVRVSGLSPPVGASVARESAPHPLLISGIQQWLSYEKIRPEPAHWCDVPPHPRAQGYRG
jgi:hypothetical protein